MVRFGMNALYAAALSLAWTASATAAEPVRVVTTIKPVHSLVAGVMNGVAEPELLVSGGGSPHAYALKPSQARSLEQAGMVIRVSEALESFLNRPVANLATRADIVTLDKASGLTLYKGREGGLWETHDHDEGKPDSDHGSNHGEEAGKHGHGEEAEKHAHGDTDPHLWLDPTNAQTMTAAIAAALSQKWPSHKETFEANAARLQSRLAALDEELRTTTAPLHGKPYIVFHDAYRYFEERYGLQPAGAITVSPDRIPGAKRLVSIRERIKDAKAACVFVEPQFEPKLVATLIEGTAARRGVLDPLGAELSPGTDLYFTLMRTLAASLSACLTPRR